MSQNLTPSRSFPVAPPAANYRGRGQPRQLTAQTRRSDPRPPVDAPQWSACHPFGRCAKPRSLPSSRLNQTKQRAVLCGATAPRRAAGRSRAGVFPGQGRGGTAEVAMSALLLDYLPLVVFIAVALAIGLALLVAPVPRRLQAARPREAVGLRMRLQRLRRRAHEVRRALLPGRDPVHHLRSRGGLPVPLGGRVPRDRRCSASGR